MPYTAPFLDLLSALLQNTTDLDENHKAIAADARLGRFVERVNTANLSGEALALERTILSGNVIQLDRFTDYFDTLAANDGCERARLWTCFSEIYESAVYSGSIKVFDFVYHLACKHYPHNAVEVIPMTNRMLSLAMDLDLPQLVVSILEISPNAYYPFTLEHALHTYAKGYPQYDILQDMVKQSQDLFARPTLSDETRNELLVLASDEI